MSVFRRVKRSRIKVHIESRETTQTYLTTSRPTPAWKSSDWTANYEPPSTQGSTAMDHFKKRIYYLNKYRKGV